MKQEEWGQIRKSALLKCLLARSSAVLTGQGVEIMGAQRCLTPFAPLGQLACGALSPTQMGPLCAA